MKKINPLSLLLKLGLVIVLAYITQSQPDSFKKHKINKTMNKFVNTKKALL